MQIFFSHSGRDKPLLREIRQHLPKHLGIWIDEFEIPVGANLSSTIKKAIKTGNDLIVFFLAPEAMKSVWVKKELKWAMQREKALHRNFIIPVLLDKKCWKDLPEHFQERKYLLCSDFTAIGVKQLAQKLYEELFSCFLALADNQSKHHLNERKNKVSKIANAVSDKQATANRKSKLTPRRLEKIISSLDPLSKILLLSLYEFVVGKFSSEARTLELERPDFLTIEFRIPKLGTWVHTFNWSSRSLTFRVLTFEYGLGNHQYIVRNVFLNGIASLSSTDRQRIFNGIDILGYTPER